MMMNLLMTNTRSFLLRMPSLFLSFQGRTWKGLIGVTFYQHRSLHFEESTTTSQVMSGLATLVHLPGIFFWIIKDTWPQNSGVAAYSSYIGLVCTRIVYPQQEDPDIKINQNNYFDIIGTVPPPTNHGIWVACIISLWYRMFSWLNMIQEYTYPI